MRNSGGFTRSRKCKDIDISIDVIVPLYFIYSYIVNRIPKEQGKGIIKKRQNPKTRKNQDNTRKRQNGGVQEGYKKQQTEHRGENNLHK